MSKSYFGSRVIFIQGRFNGKLLVFSCYFFPVGIIILVFLALKRLVFKNGVFVLGK
jgi:hypothetical protein